MGESVRNECVCVGYIILLLRCKRGIEIEQNLFIIWFRPLAGNIIWDDGEKIGEQDIRSKKTRPSKKILSKKILFKNRVKVSR